MSVVRVNINLDKTVSDTPVQLLFSITKNNFRFRLYTGFKILPRAWDKKNQKVKISFEGHKLINSKLKEYTGEIHKQTLQLELMQIEITKNSLLPRLSFFKAAIKTNNNPFFSYYQSFIEARKNLLTKESIKSLQSTSNRLEKFEKQTGFVLSFSNMDANFYNAFYKFYIDIIGGFNNSFGKHIKTVKTFLNWCVDENITNNLAFRKFKVLKESKPVLFLTIAEIKKIELLPLTGLQDAIRDIFLIECYCGLRFGDVMNLKAENIKDNNIEIITGKTKDVLQIPIANHLKIILDKYFVVGKKKFPIISNQVVNRNLKLIGEAANIDDAIIYTKYKKTEKVNFELKKFDKISTHTARHSFISNSLALGILPETVRQIVGHGSLKTLARYSQKNNISNIEQMNKWNEI
jgi:site-specific recombinase XerD